MRMLYAMLIPLMMQGCAELGQTSKSANQELDESPLPADYFVPQQRCINSWQGLIDEWVAATGGFGESIEDTRARIRLDRDSRLSEIVRRVWTAQDDGMKNDWWSLARRLELSTSEVVGPARLP